MKTSLAPMLSIRRGSSAVEFYKSAFGARVLFRITDDSGAVLARFAIQGAEFWVTDESSENGNYSPETLNGSTARMVLVVEDPDEMFDRAVAAGATIVWPVQQSHGWRVGRVADPYGHHWEIGKPL